MHAATQSSPCGSEHNGAKETLEATVNDIAATNTLVENSASPEEATTEEVGLPTVMDSPAVQRTPAATADVDGLQKEEQAIAISMAMRKKNKLVIDRQEVSQNPNRSASEQRRIKAPSNKLLVETAKTEVQWEEYLVKQYDEAFPPPKLLEDTPGKPAKKKQQKETAGSRKSVSGPGPKQVVKNTIQLVKKIEAILKLSAFNDIAEAWESIKLEPSVGLKYAILTRCTRQFNDICAGLYVGRCDGNQGRTSKHGTFGISLLLETCKWLTFYIADNVKKPSAIGTLDQLATFLRRVRKATRGHALSPLLTPQEVQKLNSQLQHDAAEDDEVLEDDSDKGEEASDAKTGSKRKGHAKENVDRKRVHKTKEGDYIVPDEVIRLFAEQLNGNQLNVKIVKKDGIFVFDLTGED
ncbi:hypothetical protein BDR26DRAFT_959179 [Obelidium mucronatum]|nr:hypothetical protein BDR26DRAFT_959179 [Obelidium mucronatum]